MARYLCMILTASGNERDFMAVVSIPVTFAPSGSALQTKMIQIFVVNDMFVEYDENLRFNISSIAEPLDLTFDLRRGEASIFIRNDDGLCFI